MDADAATAALKIKMKIDASGIERADAMIEVLQIGLPGVRIEELVDIEGEAIVVQRELAVAAGALDDAVADARVPDHDIADGVA